MQTKGRLHTRIAVFIILSIVALLLIPSGFLVVGLSVAAIAALAVT